MLLDDRLFVGEQLFLVLIVAVDPSFLTTTNALCGAMLFGLSLLHELLVGCADETASNPEVRSFALTNLPCPYL